MYKIKEMPKYERPRERLINYGVEALSNEELLAILLRTGTKDENVFSLAKKVIYHLNFLSDLKNITVEELLQIKGIKLAKATTILASIELGRRLNYKKELKQIKEPKDIYYLLAPEIGHLEQEHFLCLYLNIKQEIIYKRTLYIGTINQTVIHPREIFKYAHKLSAAKIVFAHNHPTGDSSPSNADLDATKKLIDAANILGIEVLDHIIIGNNEFYSVRGNKKELL